MSRARMWVRRADLFAVALAVQLVVGVVAGGEGERLSWGFATVSAAAMTACAVMAVVERRRAGVPAWPDGGTER